MDSAQATTIETILPKYTLNESQEKQLILRHYRALMRSLGPKLKPGDKKTLRAAFEMAADAHKTMRRKSGEPYILHPIAVAMICVEEIGLGVRSTICALLHDTVEDTATTIKELQDEFGVLVASLVEELTSDAKKIAVVGKKKYLAKKIRLTINI